MAPLWLFSLLSTEFCILRMVDTSATCINYTPVVHTRNSHSQPHHQLGNTYHLWSLFVGVVFVCKRKGGWVGVRVIRVRGIHKISVSAFWNFNFVPKWKCIRRKGVGIWEFPSSFPWAIIMMGSSVYYHAIHLHMFIDLQLSNGTFSISRKRNKKSFLYPSRLIIVTLIMLIWKNTIRTFQSSLHSSWNW